METHFLMALQLTEQLWEQGGAFGTVTPGAKICCEQAALQSMRMLLGENVTLNDDYKNVMLGRFGRNTGLEKGIGDTVTLETLAAHEGVGLFPKASGKGLVAAEHELEKIEGSLGTDIPYGEGRIPERDEVILKAALTAKGGKYEIFESLLTYLRTGERTGSIEPPRGEFGHLRTQEEMTALAQLVNLVGMDAAAELVQLETGRLEVEVQASRAQANAEGAGKPQRRVGMDMNVVKSRIEAVMSQRVLGALGLAENEGNKQASAVREAVAVLAQVMPKNVAAEVMRKAMFEREFIDAGKAAGQQAGRT